jgi:hypothetical protein
MDERVLAEPRQRRCREIRDDGLTFVPGIDARRKTTEGNAKLDALEHGDEVEEQRRRPGRCDEGQGGKREETGRRCGEHGQSDDDRDAVVEAGGDGGGDLRRRGRI